MKKILIPVLLVACAVSFAACKKASAPATDTPATDAATSGSVTPTLTPEKIAGDISAAITKRVVACNKESGGEAIDEAQYSTTLTTNLSQSLSAKAASVDEASLTKCVDAINAATCEAMNSETPPAGCEFIN